MSQKGDNSQSCQDTVVLPVLDEKVSKTSTGNRIDCQGFYSVSLTSLFHMNPFTLCVYRKKVVHTCHISHLEMKSHRIWCIGKPNPINKIQISQNFQTILQHIL